VNYLIDTNIISEVRKGERCNGHVAAWFASIDDHDIYLSVLVLGEIREGVERARRTDAAQARALRTIEIIGYFGFVLPKMASYDYLVYCMLLQLLRALMTTGALMRTFWTASYSSISRPAILKFESYQAALSSL
jgi:hypothetical protein